MYICTYCTYICLRYTHLPLLLRQGKFYLAVYDDESDHWDAIQNRFPDIL